jgi:hypothetical protein
LSLVSGQWSVPVLVQEKKKPSDQTRQSWAGWASIIIPGFLRTIVFLLFIFFTIIERAGMRVKAGKPSKSRKVATAVKLATADMLPTASTPASTSETPTTMGAPGQGHQECWKH